MNDSDDGPRDGETKILQDIDILKVIRADHLPDGSYLVLATGRLHTTSHHPQLLAWRLTAEGFSRLAEAIDRARAMEVARRAMPLSTKPS